MGIVALIGVVSSFAATRSSLTSITGMQWNPHWECFDNTDCKSHAYAELIGHLSAGDKDFVSIVELEDGGEFQTPAGWARKAFTCPQGGKTADQISLFYRDVWEPIIVNTTMGCILSDSGRAYIVWAFRSTSDTS